jgi:hypothetical protein
MSSAAVNATRHPRFQRIHIRFAVQLPSSLLRMAADNDIEIAVSEPIIAEVIGVLRE